MRSPQAIPIPAIPILAAIGGAALVFGVAGALLVGWWLGLLLFLLIGGAGGTVIGTRLRSADERALRFAGPVRVAHEHGDPAEARLLNLLEGLAPTAGLPRPRCLVIDDPAPNALPLGRDARRGSLIVTTGLLAGLSRIELEAVVAHGLVRLRDGGTAAATVALALTGRPGAPTEQLGLVDMAAVALTRYPPGLLGALKVVGAGGPAAPAAADAVLAPLWLAPPGDEAGLARRVAALEEL